MTSEEHSKEAMKRGNRHLISDRGSQFVRPNNWIDLSDADKQELHQKHIKKVRKHETKMHIRGAQAVCLELFAQSKPFRYFFAFFDLLCQMGGK